ncbi:MBL fold metallo-hydrolase [Brevibacillus reuszeri]|uniref:MBL fold metallo-hydrolase n=1 Tax=Brevibacillus reuszeri TaxID=54915 RepID=UPI003D226441
MKVTYIQSACVIVENRNVKVLCDPWLTDGAYYGSWYHYPPLKYAPEDFNDVDYIYLSHVHQDHTDVGTLKRISKDIPIIIHDYADRFFFNQIKGLGFKQVIELANQQEYELDKDFKIEVLASDNCDPEACKKYFGCNIYGDDNRTKQVDTLAVFSSENKVIVNSNDCNYDMARGTCRYIKEKYKEIDMILVGYIGAGPYPQCFENYNLDEKIDRCEAKKSQYLLHAVNFIKHLSPRYYMPFAGQYTLGGKLSELNFLRGDPELEEVPDIFNRLALKHQYKSEIILLNSGDFFCLNSRSKPNTYVPPCPIEREKYIQNVLSSKKYDYEKPGYFIEESNREDLIPLLLVAQKRMLRYQDKWEEYRSDWKFYLDTGQEYLYCVPFNGNLVSSIPVGSEVEPYIKISLDYSLLKMILDRKAHWSNAQIGSHLKYYRSPDMFDRRIHHLLSYLHC